MLYKACPKCHGDVFRQQWPDLTVDLTCLQCGRILTPRETLELQQQVTALKARRLVAAA
jgi:RNA polymerase subunit RPABC4/transcription elongation factor Spt4